MLKNRVMRYAKTPVNQDHHVDVIALRQNSKSQPEVVNGLIALDLALNA